MRLVLVGWGAIGRTVARLLGEVAPGVELVGVATQASVPLDLPPGATLVREPAELDALRPDVVAEAAGRDGVAPWGRAALDSGASFVVSSVSAFADASLLAELTERAEAASTTLRIQPGAVAGVEALAAARYLGIDEVRHRIVKPPAAWRGTDAERRCRLDELEGPSVFFTGSAAETASAFPKNANVAMTTALASLGPDETRIELVADPGAVLNRHEVWARGAFGELSTVSANQPLPDNPKSSSMAALALVRIIAAHTPGLTL